MNMNSRNICALVLILCLIREVIVVNKSIAESRGFLIRRTISVIQRSCNCSMSFSCSCCQSVIILYTKKEKNLCVNITYQRNGLNVDIALNSDTISTRTVINYETFQYCTYVPGCLFSTACVNILELNRFPRSVTTCLRLDIYAKKQLWQINYDCINISTELPMMSPNNITRMTDTTSEEMFMTENDQMGQSPMTESTTAMPSSEMMTMQTPVMSSTEINGMTEEAEEMTEMLETTSEETAID